MAHGVEAGGGGLGRRLLEFAVVSDSHVNEAEDRSVSPYRSNRRANARFRYVVGALARDAPAFVLHLGDMANPLPELPSFAAAAARFHDIAGEIDAPLHLAPGNHCLGDKPRGWVPVPRISPQAIRQYRSTFGELFYSFDRGPCHFAVLASLLVESGLPEEAEQRRWIESDLERAASRGRRLWLAMHYPPFVASPDEPGSYDNVDPPGRAWLLGLLERWPVEAVFSGHVHNYFYNRHAGAALYTAPATSFVRQDYGELYRVAPRDREGGRDDGDKLGYLRVRVYERGHVVELVRTGGRELAAEGGIDDGPRIAALHPREAGPRPLAVEMRDNWLARVSLRPNNSVSPFTRRAARNDWAVAALDEMGIARLRLARQELEGDGALERLTELRDAGLEFVVYSLGPPGDDEIGWVERRRDLFCGWELILRRDDVARAARALGRSGASGAGERLPPCFLNPVRDVTRGEIDDANVRHVANYGFQPAGWKELEALCREEPVAGTFAGLVFRIRRRGRPEVAPWEAIGGIGRLGGDTEMRHQAHLLFSGNVTAERFLDDRYAANRVAEAALAAAVAGNVDVCFDTFEDVDRGYFVRHGLVDRRYNPRQPARVLRHLNAALAGLAADAFDGWSAARLDGGRLLAGFAGERFAGLILPRRPLELETVAAPRTIPAGRVTLLDLDLGQVREDAGSIDGPRVRLSDSAPLATAHLLIAGGEGPPFACR